MKKNRSLWKMIFLMVCCLGLTGGAVFTGQDGQDVDREELWKKVTKAQKNGLPKTAISHLKKIIPDAIKDKAFGEAVKAVCKKNFMEGNIQGRRAEEQIARLQKEYGQYPKEMRSILSAVLGHRYWQYYQQNQWRFRQRTQTAASPSKDIKTWALPQIMAEIDKHFTAAFADKKTLRSIKIADWKDVLQKGTMSDNYRPTLYDFLAQEALNFYQSASASGPIRSDEFEFSVQSPIFGDNQSFLAWDIKSTDDTSLKLKAIRLYQELIKFHSKDKDPSARLDLEFYRYRFGKNNAYGENKNQRYLVSLRNLAERTKDHEIFSRIQAEIALVLRGQSKLVEARKEAKIGEDAFPKSIGGRQCFNIIQQIEQKTATINTERVWNHKETKITVNYKNIEKIHCRLVPNNFVSLLNDGKITNNLSINKARQLLQDPVRSWSITLKKTNDFQQRTHLSNIPGDLKKGAYWLIASTDPKFRSANDVVYCTDVWVSDLAVVTRNLVGSKNNRLKSGGGFVLNADNGKPLEGIKVRYWAQKRVNRRRVWQEQKPVSTDRNGVFRINAPSQSVICLVQKGDDTLVTGTQYFYNYNHGTNHLYRNVQFFTDRSLYRPGQTISFKGICYQYNQGKNDYRTMKNASVNVIFRDVNGKEIAKQTLKSNDFGSFSGSFTAPRDRATGRLSLQASGGANGYASIRVEEYKRPKFQVSMEKPKAEVKLDKKVTVSGKASAYTGASIDGAKVRWRVVRVARQPVWWYYRCWWLPPGGNRSKEIARGTSKTNAAGKFSVSFKASPDLSVDPKSEPTFHYTVYADVVDTAGETRSSSVSVAAGYTAIKASISVSNSKEKVDAKNGEKKDAKIFPSPVNNDWLVAQKGIDLSITTQTLNNQPAKASGSVTVFQLKGPKKVHRAKLYRYRPYLRGGLGAEVKKAIDWSNLNAWPLGESVYTKKFQTDDSGKTTVNTNLEAGVYRAKVETKDKFGKKVQTEISFLVLDPSKKQFNVKLTNILKSPNWTAKVGQEFRALWGSGYSNARCFVEVFHRDQVLQQFWTNGENNQFLIKQKVSEKLRGGFTVHTTMVQENRIYSKSQQINVPWDNKDLSVSWERFRNKLKPGENEKWTATIKGPKAESVVAEMVATLYDASLDAFAPHNFLQRFNIFRRNYTYVNTQFQNRIQNLRHIYGRFPYKSKSVNLTYRHFSGDVRTFMYAGHMWRDRGMRGVGGGGMFGGMQKSAAAPSLKADSAMANSFGGLAEGAESDDLAGNMETFSKNGRRNQSGEKNGGQNSLDQVQARKNLNETAFFFPHLVSNKDGSVKIEFEMPEALTEWKFLGFAHDNELRSGFLTGKTVTAIDLMVQPNPPRFLREGDQLEFTVKVSNQSPTAQKGTVRLTFADARTLKSVDALLGNQKLEQEFQIPSKESRTFSWKISVPDSLGVLVFKAVGSTGRLSDGEEAYLPVLSRRVLVTESIPMPISGKGENTFKLSNLADKGFSKSAEHKSLKVQMVSNPSWYAVMALPYLMEYPHQCSEQIFNRLYANKLASNIANSDPKIRRVFDLWRGTDALDSPLSKNEDVKAVLIQETPWLLDADNESKARRNVGLLFEKNRLKQEFSRAFNQLAKRQMAEGGWPWFSGGRYSPYITLYITTGFGRLRHLGVDVDASLAKKAIAQLDRTMVKRYTDIIHKDTYVLGSFDCMYLYCRSFFLEEVKPSANAKTAIDYFLSVGKKRWLKIHHRQSKAQLALALKRFDDIAPAKKIMRSIKEHSVTDKEMGRFWRDTEYMGYWYQAPIETQAYMIEAFDEVMNDQKVVEQCKVWLLKQKQTQDWKTTKATADAVYALLLRGENLLASDELVQVSVAGKAIKPIKVEAGTGFFEKQYVGPEITPAHGTIKTKKVDKGIAWGSAHWQYLEDIGKVKLYSDTPLKVTKTLYQKVNTNKGPTLKKVDGPVHVGDQLVVRVTIKTDRDMEFVHLKDHRGSGTEPVDVLSKYRFQDGLYYYQSTKDTATHFFIDFLPKGTYVFEYTVRPQHAGRYQTGYANLQSMYAPEFGGHSQSILLEVLKN